MAIVAHEVGHAVYRYLPMQQINLMEGGIQEGIERRLASVRDGHLYPGKIETILRIVTDHWKQELAADAVSYFLCGPAAFFALSEFLAYMPKEGFNEKYPPNSLRRRVLHDAVVKGGFREVFERHTGAVLSEDFNSPLMVVTPSADKIFEKETNPNYPVRRNPKYSAVFTELPQHILTLVPSIYDAVFRYLSKISPDMIYTPKRLDGDLQNHLRPLLLALPPIEVDGKVRQRERTKSSRIDRKLNSKQPVDFASILNIGWAALLTKPSELSIRASGMYDEDCEKMEKMQGLLLKAVELSEALRSWRGEKYSNGGVVGL
jgi:hypothetical protein